MSNNDPIDASSQHDDLRAELDRALRREEALHQEREIMLAAMQEIRPGRDTQELFAAIMGHLQSLFGFQYGDLYAPRSEGWIRVASTNTNDPGEVAVDGKWMRRIASGEIRILEDLQKEPEWQAICPAALSAARSAIFLPLQYGGAPLVGIASHEQVGIFQEHHRELTAKFIPILNQALSVIAGSRETKVHRNQIALLEDGTHALGVGLFRWNRDASIDSANETLLGMSQPWGDCEQWWQAVRDQSEVEELASALQHGRSVEILLRDRKGHRHAFRFARGGSDSREDWMAVLVTDLTAERHAEEVRREAEQRYSALFQSSPDGILVHDCEGFIRETNLRAEEMLGEVGTSLVGRRWSDFFNEDSLAKLHKIETKLQSEGAARYEVCLQRDDGNLFDAEVHTRTLTFHGERLGQTFLRNISERKKAEKTLRASELQTSASLAAALDAVVTLDHQGLVIEFNPAAVQTFGWTKEEALGRSLVELFIPEELRGAHEAGMQAYLATGKAKVLGQRLELPAVRKDGVRILLEIAITRIPGPDGRPNFTGFMRDITQQKADQEGMRLAKEEAEHASRSKTDFLAAMSHELRTPLHVIAGMTELAIAENPPEEVEQHLQVIESSARCLLDLIADLLDFGRLEAGEFAIRTAATDLGAMLEEIRGMTEHRIAKRGLEFLWQVPGDLPAAIDLDPVRVRQVILNLLGNAEKFTKKGFIGLKLQLQHEGPKPSLILEVRDSGIGFPQEQAEHLFRRFAQLDQEGTNRSHGGAGLGLAISRALLELMGGSIEAFSEPAVGSLFRVELPLRILQAERVNQVQEDDYVFGAGRSILLVDDHGDNRKLASRFLEKAGFQVQQAASGLKALHWLGNNNTCDIILMDLEMPQMDGIETTSRIHDLLGDAAPPIVALTAHAVAGFRDRCMKAGMVGYLTKPFGRKDLLKAVRPLLDGEASVPVAEPQSPSAVAAVEEMPAVITVRIDADTMPLVSGYLNRCAEMVAESLELARAQDAQGVRGIAHKLKGSGASYGIPEITRLGEALHGAAVAAHWQDVERHARELEEYLQCLQVEPRSGT